MSGFAVELPNQKLDGSSSEATAQSTSEATNPKVIAEMVIMGTGTSIGVPVVGCRCSVCLSDNPRNRRMRSGVLIRAPHGEMIIDAGPELRLQLVRERATLIRAAIFTHSHADHIMGIDDLRIFGFQLNDSVPLYCEEVVEEQIRQTFSYAFSDPSTHAHKYAAPRLRFERITEGQDFSLLGLNIRTIRLKHGELPILGFRIGNVAFCTDVSTIPADSREQLKNLDVLVLNTFDCVFHTAISSVAIARRGSVIGFNTSYSTSINSAAARAVILSCATTTARTSPAYDV